MNLLGLRHDVFSRAVKPKILRVQEVSRAYGIQDPYRIRTEHPVTLLNHNVAGLVGRYIDDMRVARVFLFRVGTERASLVGLRDVFTKPELVQSLFGLN